jgi:hypothetical protein
MIAGMFPAIVFFGLITSAIASETLDVPGKCSSKFCGDDPATTRNAPKQSIAGGACRKDDRFVEKTLELRLESIKSPRLPLIL